MVRTVVFQVSQLKYGRHLVMVGWVRGGGTEILLGGLAREAVKHGGAKELEQLLSCVNSRTLDEVDLTENVAKLDRWPQSHGVLEVT